LIQLGQKVRDKVTGFEGITTARCEYLNGCIQYCVSPRIDKDGKKADYHYMDEGQLEVIKGEGINIRQPRKEPGGVMNNTPSEVYRG